MKNFLTKLTNTSENQASDFIRALILCLVFPAVFSIAACTGSYIDPSQRGSQNGDGAAGTVSSPDFTAPLLTGGTKSGLITQSGTTAALSFNSNKAGAYYCLVRPSASDAPSAAEIRTYGKTAPAAAGQNIINIGGLSAGADYKAYIAVKDNAGNTSNILCIANINPSPAGLAAGLYDGIAPITIQPPFTLAKALAWLAANAASDTAYTIMLAAGEDIAAQTLDTAALHNAERVSITLRGVNTERVIQLTGAGYLFTVNADVALILDQNITLKGGGNSSALIAITAGTLEMRSGSKITGNISSGQEGGGVLVYGGTFIMEGGEISGNSANYGGGVFHTTGTFTMNGGEISGNHSNYNGSGVMVRGGFDADTFTFTMNGGEICGNTGDRGSSAVCSWGAIINMTGGKISDNASPGGGVSNTDLLMGWDADAPHYRGTFTMSGGEICGHAGSGVVNSGSDFTLTGSGKIYGNQASAGAGVYSSNGSTFIMSGGEISGNFADDREAAALEGLIVISVDISDLDGWGEGGGVFYGFGDTFRKTGGIIYGDTDNTPGATENTSIRGKGHAVFYMSDDGSRKWRNSTLGPGDNLSGSAAAGWE